MNHMTPAEAQELLKEPAAYHTVTERMAIRTVAALRLEYVVEVFDPGNPDLGWTIGGAGEDEAEAGFVASYLRESNDEVRVRIRPRYVLDPEEGSSDA